MHIFFFKSSLREWFIWKQKSWEFSQQGGGSGQTFLIFSFMQICKEKKFHGGVTSYYLLFHIPITKDVDETNFFNTILIDSAGKFFQLFNPFWSANERTEMKLKIYLSEAWMCSEFGINNTNVKQERVKKVNFSQIFLIFYV